MTVAPYYIFSTKILSKDPYLKSFISRVRTKHRERFSSFRASVIRLLAEPFFLAALHRAVGTIAVNLFSVVAGGFNFFPFPVSIQYTSSTTLLQLALLHCRSSY